MLAKKNPKNTYYIIKYNKIQQIRSYIKVQGE